MGACRVEGCGVGVMDACWAGWAGGVRGELWRLAVGGHAIRKRYQPRGGAGACWEGGDRGGRRAGGGREARRKAHEPLFPAGKTWLRLPALEPIDVPALELIVIG